MENLDNLEAQSLTGQASTAIRRNYASRKRQRIATIGLAFVLISVVASVLIWIIIFQPKELGCITLQDAICQEHQGTYFDESLFKLLSNDIVNSNYVFRSNFPLKKNYQIDTTLLHIKIKELIQTEEFNPNDFYITYFALADTSANSKEKCDVAGMICYEEANHTDKSKPKAKVNYTQIYGDETNPFDLEQDHDYGDLSWQSDRLDLKVQEIENLIKGSTHNIVIICGQDGINETAELAASYQINNSQNFTEVITEIIGLGSRKKNNINSIMWYCKYVQSVENDSIDCQNVFKMPQFSDIEFEG